MSECMKQEDAMNMSAEQAIQILKPMQMMMRDQNGCPISDAYFALGKAIEALEQKVDSVERKRGEWVDEKYREPLFDIAGVKTWGVEFRCSECGFVHTVIEANGRYKFCPNCGADMRKVGEK